MKKVLLEGLFVGLVGAALAFAANGLSPRGLKLTRDYFPGESRVHSPLGAGANVTAADNGTNKHAFSPPETLAARLKQNGLQLIGADEVLRLFHDPRREQDLVVFVDANNDKHYQAGHIPGAYQFDPNYQENYLATIPVCQAAQQVVVYCNGGECTDSESAALVLARDGGVAKEKLFVYGGGITEWTDRGLPLEIGSRKTGKMSGDTK